MFRHVGTLIARVWQWFKGLPLAAAVIVGLLVFAGFTSAGVWSYKKWDYIEHDNNFCLDCHLMEAPFELVEESAHRDMSCKACHNPNLFDRAMMGVSQVVKNPDSLTVHAEVPNEACASCHVTGDPETWNTIARSVGHRVHFESEDPELEGLMCVECHSTSLHQFTSTDDTCRDCHTDNDVIMAGMNEVAMNCASCHAFSEPLESIPVDDPLRPSPEGALEHALRPGSTECLSCHTMSTMVVFAEDDPHEAACGACHNPHTQEFAADATEGCTAAGCHDGPVQDLSTFHGGIASEALTNCAECHDAHDFHAEGQDCLACHTDIFLDGEVDHRPTDVGAGGPAAGAGFHGIGFVERLAPLIPADPHVRMVSVAPASTSVPPSPLLPSPTVSPDSTFRHAEHREVECLSCHTMDGTHGELTVDGLEDCRGCHHTPPRSSDCATCHSVADVQGMSTASQMSFGRTAGEPIERAVAFNHDDHAQTDCATCHTEARTLGAGGLDCAGCHEEHHGGEVTCTTCHSAAPQEEHEVEAHLGCASAGCHATVPFEDRATARQVCLVCHVEQNDHKLDAPETCAECHALPEHGIAAGGGV